MIKEKALQILLVEDNAGDARLLREMFRKEAPDSFALTHFLRMSEAVVHLAKGGVDIVLLDMGLPDGHGLDTVRRAHAAAPDVPMVVLTGLDDEALAAQAMKEGAQDYLIKGQIENRALPRALRHAIERHRMQSETDRILTHQLEFKDEFLSHVSHELRSPLTAIYQFVTILLDGLAGELNPEQQEHLGVVLRNVKQLQSMINDLLDVARVQTRKFLIDPQSTSVSDAMVYAVQTLQGSAAVKSITVTTDIESGLPFVFADPIRLRQILVILVDNAIKFTPENGAVKLQARSEQGNSNVVVLEISDSGRGIPADMNERIFERLFQASDVALAGRRGLGLGLYICKELVARQGGQISARNGTENGAIFSLVLPVFSLIRLLTPIVQQESTEIPLVLVLTEIGSRTGWLSEEVRSEISQAIRDLLQNCLHSDRDVLLPKMGLAGAKELFFIVAATDEIGGEALTKRIRERMEANEHIGRAALTVSASYRRLLDYVKLPRKRAEDGLNALGVQIQEFVDGEFSSRKNTNG